MSGLRIRSEAMPDPVWPLPFLPPQAAPAEDDTVADSDFAAFLQVAARELSQLFGAAVEVLPGRPPKPRPGEATPRIAAALAGLLATLRLGGDPARGFISGGGVVTARQATAIAAVLDAVADRVWPTGAHEPGIDLDIACGSTSGHAFVPAPERPPAVVPVPVAALARRLFEMPVRVRVELASDMTLIAALLPLYAGRVLPIDPSPEMPLILGDHRIGRATLAPLADGRQQATIVAIDVEAIGGRP